MSTELGSSRTARLSAIVLTAFTLLAANLAVMQLWNGERYRGLSERNRIRIIYLEGPRGRILDRHGRALASNRLSFNCSAVPQEARDTIARSCGILGPLLDEPPEELEKRFERGKAGRFNTIVLAEDIPPARAMAIEEKLDLLPGLLIETRPQREYPLAEAAAHLTGYDGPLTGDEEDSLELYEYRLADWVGREGVEKTYEAYLRGRSGGLQIEVNNRGRIVKPLGVKEPIEGKDVQLTVDAELQRYVQGLLTGRKGAVLVMELEEGGLLAVNSSPSFDPNLFASVRGRKSVGPYLTDAEAPMMNRALRGQYPAGSIFKIVPALAALERRKASFTSEVFCSGFLMVGGKRFGCWKSSGHGRQAMAEAFAHSCNVYFYTIGMNAGLEAILEKARSLGFGDLTGIDLPGERRGFLPSREWKKRVKRESWYDGETANLSIGQGYLQITPTQALAMVSAIAVRGEMLRPHVLERVNGVKVSERSARRLPISEGALDAVRQGLERVVNSETGTGRLARAKGVRVSGKTGTAQSGQKRTHAWFVGYAPPERPKVAVVVFLDQGGRGGVDAAGIASSVFGWLKEASYL